MKVLVVSFEPFGILGNILRRNDSLICMRRLEQEFPQYNYLKLPVNEKALEILDEEINKLNPSKIFLMGVGGEIRIETKTHNKGNWKHSDFAKRLKKIFNYGDDKIGDYYCNKVYYKALSMCRKTVFIHMPYFVRYLAIKSIFIEFLRQ
jgi:pyrrolidone-carboxylate peptidase